MRTRFRIKMRVFALAVALAFLPTALMGGVCLVSKCTNDGDCRAVVTQDVCGAKAPGVVSVTQYTAAIYDATPHIALQVSTIVPPAPDTAFAQADPGDADKPPRHASRA